MLKLRHPVRRSGFETMQIMAQEGKNSLRFGYRLGDLGHDRSCKAIFMVWRMASYPYWAVFYNLGSVHFVAGPKVTQTNRVWMLSFILFRLETLDPVLRCLAEKDGGTW